MVLVGGVILLGTGAVAAALTEGGLRDALRTGGIFVLGLAAGLALLSLSAWLLLRGLRGFIRRAPARIPAPVRQGIANLFKVSRATLYRALSAA